jgi:uncharacterized membrane protein YedE/YeeE
MMRALAALICGFIFGLGLVISGMTDTARVLGFLDVLAIPKGTWDPTLVIVMAAALIVSVPGFMLARRRSRPLLADAPRGRPGRRSIRRCSPARLCSAPAGGWSGSAPGRRSPIWQPLRRRSLGLTVHDLWRRARTRAADAVPAVDG